MTGREFSVACAVWFLSGFALACQTLPPRVASTPAPPAAARDVGVVVTGHLPYHLTPLSTYRGAATDGGDLGADVAALERVLEDAIMPRSSANLIRVTFTCPDHAVDTNHAVQLLRPEGTFVQLFDDVGDPPAAADGTVTVTIDIEGVTLSAFVVQARAKIGEVGGPWSEFSDVWPRTPANPGKPTISR